ncbi:MAG: hypothetical protein AAB250_13235, partial [Bdellovibrionota bacterium]
MKKKISILTAAFVSVLGLSSCSPDPVEDAWRLREPHISDPAQPGREISIARAQLELPSADSELVFAEADLVNTSLEVTASCRSGNDRIDETLSFRAAHRIPLGSLWPLEFWRKLNGDQLEASVCTFSFLAKTETGSTHTFEIAGLRLKNFATLDAHAAKRKPGEAWTLFCSGFT